MEDLKITNKGYRILLNHPRVNEFKKELYICPFIENAQRYPIFRISTNYLYIPKYYGIEKLGMPNFIKEQEGIDILGTLNFNATLRDYQIDIANKILNELNNNSSTLASLYTGWGKTFLALWLIYKLGKKTLIVVHTENLLQQWKIEIKKFLNIECGVIQGPIIDIENKSIVIGMIQSLSMKDYDNKLFQDFGFTIYDEVHHTPGRCFSKIFYKIGSKYNLGLSATLTRSDGLTKVIKYFLGSVVVNVKLNIIKPKIKIVYSEIEPIKEKTMINGKINTQSMITDLCNVFQRNLLIIKLITNYFNEGRKILVLTERILHCKELKRLLSVNLDDSKIGLYIGGMKIDSLEESNKKSIIIATYKMASEGYNNPLLDTLILATPIVKIEQAVGRILRQKNDNEPLVVDLVDSFSFLYSYFSKRLKFYKSKKYIDDAEYNDNNDQEIKFDKCIIVE